MTARTVQDGVIDRDIIFRQTQAALAMLRAAAPDRIVTLGGECSVSVVPFTYLAARYGGDVAMVWIDAHPDLTWPGDVYQGYHAMAVAACMGDGEQRIASLLPARFSLRKSSMWGCGTGSGMRLRCVSGCTASPRYRKRR